MNVEVTKNMKNTEALIKNMGQLEKILLQAGEILEGDLIKNWNSAKGGDYVKMTPLTKEYKEYKTEKGRIGIPDIYFSGKLRQGMVTAKTAKNTVKIGFLTSPLKEQAKCLAKKRPMFMKVGDKLISKITQFVYTKLWKGVK